MARASATNPHGYLLKPFSERELHTMIQVTLARCRAERASDTAQESRRQAEKMAALGQLAAGVADDFDNLLTVIYSQLETIGHVAIAHPALAEPIKAAFGEAIEKKKLIRQLLAFSGRQKLTPGAISVNDLVANETKLLALTLGKSIQIQADLPDDLWTACIDPGPLAKALMKLASNARDAMPDGGRLTIEGQNIDLDRDPADARPDVTPGRYVLLTVADTGAGMPEHVLEHAFEPFFHHQTGWRWTRPEPGLRLRPAIRRPPHHR